MDGGLRKIRPPGPHRGHHNDDYRSKATRSICTNKPERGFTLLEVMISILVLTIGLISMLAVFSLAMASTQTAQDDMIAKQEAAEAIESVFTARNTSQISWSQIQNVPNGVFISGFQPIGWQGADGLDGTADDSPGS